MYFIYLPHCVETNSWNRIELLYESLQHPDPPLPLDEIEKVLEVLRVGTASKGKIIIIHTNHTNLLSKKLPVFKVNIMLWAP